MYDDLIKQLRETPSRSKRELLDKAADAIERLSQHWISVEDRLPEMHTETCEVDEETVEYQISDLVVAYTDQGEVAVCKYSYEDGESQWWSTDCDRLAVTHWLPLPKEG